MKLGAAPVPREFHVTSRGRTPSGCLPSSGVSTPFEDHAPGAVCARGLGLLPLGLSPLLSGCFLALAVSLGSVGTVLRPHPEAPPGALSGQRQPPLSSLILLLRVGTRGISPAFKLLVG